MKEETPKVAVVMSSYNAENYIVEQIDSVLAQVGVRVDLWIRDDGSKDSTPDLIMARYGDDPRVHMFTGVNLGACASFYEAIFTYPGECDYMQTCDADDVWAPTRLRQSIDFFESLGTIGPAGVEGAYEIVDSELKPTASGFSKLPPNGYSFENALVQTVACGSKTLFNKPAFDLIRKFRPKQAVMHDAFIYLLITAFGRLYFLDVPSCKYRQHGANVCGAGHAFVPRLRLTLKRLKSVNPYRAQAREFAERFEQELDPSKAAILRTYLDYPASFLSRISLALRPLMVKQTRRSRLLMRLTILLGIE